MPHEDDKLIPDRARKDGIPAEVAEGIKNQVDSTGHALGKAISISDTTVVDVLSEGEIEGLTEYELIGEGTEGQIGFDKVTKKYPNKIDSYINLGNINIINQNYKKAIKYLNIEKTH